MPEIKLLDALTTYTATQIAQLRLILRKSKYTLIFNSSQNWNLDNGLYQNLTVTNNFTLNFPSGASEGETAFMYVTQDATGSRILTLDSAFKTPGGSTIVLSTAANSIDRLMFFFHSDIACTVTITKDIK